MKPFLPRRFEPVAFGFLLSGMMSCVVSGLSTAIASGIHGDFFLRWMSAWGPSWTVAFPAVLVVAPLVRRILKRIIVA
jgi:hypothetical protein